MKKTTQILALLLCIVMAVPLIAAVPAFAEDKKPGPDDLKDAGDYASAPRKEESWLDEYKTGYIYAPGYCQAAYTYCNSTFSDLHKTVAQGTKVTVLAEEKGRSLVKTEEGKAFWVYTGCVADHYVAVGRRLTDNPEVDANGPCLADIEGIKRDMDRPDPKDWLDEYVECYVYAPKHHLAAEMLYYYTKPTSQEAIDKGYTIFRNMGTVKQGTAITLLAHRNNRYLVKLEDGTLFWMYDWCTSDTLVPYGEAKKD